jgi:hypothetical protein
MTLDPDEFVTLTDHGSMKLRSAVSRAMTLLPKERNRTTIVREGIPTTLNFEQIKSLAAQWDERLGQSTSFAVPVSTGPRSERPKIVGPDPRFSLFPGGGLKNAWIARKRSLYSKRVQRRC